MRVLLAGLIVAASFASAGCENRAGGAAAAGDPNAETQAIRALIDRWNSSAAERNDSAMAALYAEDAVLLPPNQPRVPGRQNIRQFWAGLWPMNASLKVSPANITVSGDLAVEEGDYRLEVPAATGPVVDQGKYLIAWAKRDGGWLITQDIWNSDRPAAGGPAPSDSAAGRATSAPR